jgi:hypothetical protein
VAGFKVWAVGEEVLAADFNSFLQQQVVAVFPNVPARDAAIVAPNEGQLCYVTADKTLYQFTGAAWVGAPWSTPWGQIGLPVSSTADAIAGGSGFVNWPGGVVTANLVANRRCRIDALVNVNADAVGQQSSLRCLFNGAPLAVVITNGVGGFVSQGWSGAAGSGGRHPIPYIGFCVSVAGPNTFQMQGNRVGGIGTNVTYMNGALVSVTDVGPAGPPA